MLVLALIALAAAPAPGCTPPPAGLDAPAALSRARTAMGAALDRPIEVRFASHTLQPYQSDRSYPPYFSLYESTQLWYAPSTGGERTLRLSGAYPETELPRGGERLSGRQAEWAVRDTLSRPLPDMSGAAQTRPLNPWAVVADFAAGRATLVGICPFRDYPRLAVERTGLLGRERLLVDRKTDLPIGLVRTEPHYLWGQVQVEYVWSNWSEIRPGGFFPLSSFRVVDGETEISRTVTSLRWSPADSTPSLRIPDPGLALPVANGFFARPAAPDTIRVDATTWLLRNPMYTVAVALARDTVFVLDATLGDARARQDSAWIGKLFPGRHPIVLVVTDLAWPHVAGVRYWVANGARVVSHQGSETFLRRIVERRWTAERDLLERRRTSARFRFQPASPGMSLGGGAVILHPIDGIASEGAVMAWLPGSRFLWPGDFIQNVAEPSQYAREVRAAVRRAGIRPEWFAAQHVGLTPWRVIDSLHADRAAATP